MITVLAYIHLYFRLPYRQTQGLAESLFGMHTTVPSYSTICKRINNLDLDLTTDRKTHGTIVIAIDSTGIKVTNRGDWMREKHGVTRKGFIKIHAAINVDSGKTTGFVTTDESSHDSNHFTELVEQSQQCGDVSCVLADGAYDSRVIFDDMYYNNIKLAVPVRKNSRSDTPSYPRRMAVRIQKHDYSEWKKSSGYGKRWIVESLFSAIKRMFGESVMAHKKENMMHEMALKMAIYNRMVLAA